jgi:hypothetical protein
MAALSELQHKRPAGWSRASMRKRKWNGAPGWEPDNPIHLALRGLRAVFDADIDSSFTGHGPELQRCNLLCSKQRRAPAIDGSKLLRHGLRLDAARILLGLESWSRALSLLRVDTAGRGSGHRMDTYA